MRIYQWIILSLFLSYRGITGMTLGEDGLPSYHFTGIRNSAIGFLEITRGAEKKVYLLGEIGTQSQLRNRNDPHAGVGVLWEL